MYKVDSLSGIFNKQYNGKVITPATLDKKIRVVADALDMVMEPDDIEIRFSIGTVIKDDDFNDWKEIYNYTLDTMPKATANTGFYVYDIYYDGEDGFIEILFADKEVV